MPADRRSRRRAGAPGVPGRPRPGVLLVALLSVVAAVAVRVGDDDGGPVGPSADGVEVAVDPGTGGTAEEEAAPLLLGTAGPVTLYVPAVDPVVVSFHEAAFPEAMAIQPVGAVTTNENSTRFTAAAQPDPAASSFHVQVSRGRSNAATSAVDVALRPDSPVLAPVSGTVEEVRAYRLYDVHDDVRLALRPDEAPDHTVVLIHVQGVRVAPGDHVEVGDVLADAARSFPFEAVVDRVFAPERYGHVHLEVKVADDG